MTKAIGYVRVSTAEQVAGFGLAVQEKAIREHCKANGWRLAGLHREEARSGGNGPDTRPALAAALAALEAGEAKVLVVYRYDRLARDLVIAETLIARVEAAGGTVVSVTEPEGQGDDATRVLIRQVLGAVAQYERAVIRARMEAGRQAAVAAGRRGQGAPPYGYRAEGGRLVPLDHEQAVLTRMRLLRADGASLRDIARTLNDEGVQARRGAWHPDTVRRALPLRVPPEEGQSPLDRP